VPANQVGEVAELAVPGKKRKGKGEKRGEE
jgi:hypothetical protein